MLVCLFDGPALTIQFRPIPPYRHIQHLKVACNSGQYDRLDLPYSLAIFFADLPAASMDLDFQWVEEKVCPSYSGLRFHPALRIAGRIVQKSGGLATAVLSADSTYQDQKLTMPNGENIVILRDDVHLGGTLIMDVNTGFPVKGEVRVKETIQHVRPRLSNHVLEKECEYVLRFISD
jgi:hypothetical protein